MKPTELVKNFKGRATYQITVGGKVDPKYMGELSDISVAHTITGSQTISTLTGKIVDQGELNGRLNILFDNQYEVISVRKLMYK